MSIEAKAVLLNNLEQQLATIITAADLAHVLTAVSDQLAGFDVEQHELGDAQPDDLLDAYIAAIQTQGRSEKTVERYKYLLSRMMIAVSVPTRQITVYHLRQYIADEKARGISDRTLEGNRQVISAYFKWLYQEGLLRSNPAANLGAIKCRKKIKDTYSETDLERLKFGCTSIRDRAIVAFLSASGCRISEMTQLNRSDVDLQSLECTVLGKGNKERTIYLDPVAGMILQEYLDTRKDTLPALFIGKRSERLTPHGVRYMLTELADRTSVPHVHPHKFRRTLATSLIRHGMPIQEVASVLGHDKLDTTMQYVILDKTDVKHDYRKFA